MVAPEIRKMYDILVSFLGKPKNELDDNLQLQFSCPRCQERDGFKERYKYHLEVNIAKGIYNCWKCSSIDSSMHGSIYKLIRKYGNQSLLKDYKDAVNGFRESSLYKIKFDDKDFQVDYEDILEDELDFPKGYIALKEDSHCNTKAFEYLRSRGIGWPIIEDYHMGFTTTDTDRKSLSNRIILPSFDIHGKMNYWTGRDFTGNKKRQRYFNPIVERKEIIFNEDKIEWNAEITLVEGPFDSIVVPNSVPLLGKSLGEDYKLYRSLYEKCNSHINIWLDVDGIESARNIYHILDNGRLKDRVRIIYNENFDKDPSEIYQKYGPVGIMRCINTAHKIKQ